MTSVVTEPDRTYLAELPQYVQDHSKWIIEVPARILAIILVALIVRAVLHAMIDRLVRPVRANEVPRLLRPFRERVSNMSFLESTGLLSQRRAQRAATIGSVLKSAVSFTLLIMVTLLVLSEVQIDLAPFIAGTSIVGVALGFGAQNIVKDFLSGMFMMLEDQYGVGDVIDFQLATGTVEAVGLRTTRLRDTDGTVWYVRNGEVLRVGNKSQGYAQVVLDVPVDSAVSVATATDVLLQAARDMAADDEWSPVFLGDPEVWGVESFTRDETVIRLVAMVRPLQQWRVGRELRRRIQDALRQIGVEADRPTGS